MIRWAFIAAAILLAVAAASVWFAFQRADFVAALISAAVTALMPVLLKRLPEKEEREWRDRQKTGEKDDRR